MTPSRDTPACGLGGGLGASSRRSDSGPVVCEQTADSEAAALREGGGPNGPSFPERTAWLLSRGGAARQRARDPELQAFCLSDQSHRTGRAFPACFPKASS